MLYLVTVSALVMVSPMLLVTVSPSHVSDDSHHGPRGTAVHSTLTPRRAPSTARGRYPHRFYLYITPS